MQKRKIFIIFLSAILIGLAIIAMFEIKKQTQEKWLAYSDSKYGYSIKYPNTWYLKKDGDVVSIESTKKPLYWDSGVGPKDPNAVAEEGYSIKIIVYNNDNNLSLAEYLKSAIPSENFVMQPIMIGRLEAVEAHEKDAWIMFLPNYFLVHNNYIYEIGCGDKSNGLNGLKDTAEQIVQSFSFTE